MESQRQFPQPYSFEFFPPRSEKGLEKLAQTQISLNKYQPEYCSVTFGAGGSSQDNTFKTIEYLLKRNGGKATPHLSCVNAEENRLREILTAYLKLGVTQVLALRGDMPNGIEANPQFRFATDLIEFIAKNFPEFEITVAAYPEFHPEAKKASLDLDNLKRKIDLGATSAVTQYFYNKDAYYHFIELCEARDITIPITPGIMPIYNAEQLTRFSNICGAELPRWIRKQLNELKVNPDNLVEYGIDVVSELCHDLLEMGAPGLHFYTLNRSEITESIIKNLQ